MNLLVKFDALVQGNAYNPQNKLINYHRSREDRTHYLQTETTSLADICPGRLFHATERG